MADSTAIDGETKEYYNMIKDNTKEEGTKEEKRTEQEEAFDTETAGERRQKVATTQAEE